MHHGLIRFRLFLCEIGRPDADRVIRLHAARPTAGPAVIAILAPRELAIEVKLGGKMTAGGLRPHAADRCLQLHAALKLEPQYAGVVLHEHRMERVRTGKLGAKQCFELKKQPILVECRDVAGAALPHILTALPRKLSTDVKLQPQMKKLMIAGLALENGTAERKHLGARDVRQKTAPQQAIEQTAQPGHFAEQTGVFWLGGLDRDRAPAMRPLRQGSRGNSTSTILAKRFSGVSRKSVRVVTET